MATYDNPYDVSIDGDDITGVVRISLSEVAAEVHASADADTHESIARAGTVSVSGVIETLDVDQAYTASDKTGTLIFKVSDVEGGTDKTFTIATTVSTGPYSASIGRDTASACSIPFLAEGVAVVT